MPDEKKGNESGAVRTSIRDMFQDDGLRAQAEALAKTVAGQPFEAEAAGQGTGAQPPVTPPGEGTGERSSSMNEGYAPEGQQQPNGQEQATGEPPSEYFGVDLSDLDPEKRTEIISHFKEQDKFIQKLMQRPAEQPAADQNGQQPAPAAQQAQQSEPSDADLLLALGIKEDDPYLDIKAEIALPLAKQLLQTQTLVNQVYESQLVDQTVRHWNDSLDTLEKQYGTIPGTRDELFEYAAMSNITTPEDAYWRVVGPARRELSDEATKARQEAIRALKLQQGSGIRPISSGETTARSLEAKTVREAVREAAKMASRELGISWEQALQERDN